MSRYLLTALLCLIFLPIYGQQSTLWGNTFKGGNADAGFIFKTGLDGSGYEIVHELDGASGGKYMGTGMILATDGLLYGTASQGGEFNRGILFRVDPMSDEFTIRHNFEAVQAYNCRLTQASNGKLYGMGAGGVGNIFEFNPENDAFTIVHQFNRPEGAAPLPEDYLLEVTPNVLYAATASGGDENNGVLFRFDIESMDYTILHHFNEGTGNSPRPGLLLASNGHLYGVAGRGGANRQGLIFKYEIDSETYSIVAHLSSEQAIPNGGLIEATNGKVYGTASIGGAINEGALFELDLSSGELATKISFAGSKGLIPDASLMQASNGLIYGNTRYGGNGMGLGAVYSYNPENDAFNTIASLNDGFPLDNVLVEVVEPVVTSVEKSQQSQIRLYPNPAQDYLNIDFDSAQPSFVIEAIAVSTGTNTPLKQEGNRVDLKHLKPGLYFIRTVHADGTSVVRKIIKQ